MMVYLQRRCATAATIAFRYRFNECTVNRLMNKNNTVYMIMS